MSGSGRSSLAVTGLPVRPLAWLVVPFLALLAVMVPVVTGTAPAAHADSITPSTATAGTAVLTVGPEKGDQTLTGLGGLSIANFKWLISAEHTLGAYNFDGTVNNGTTGTAKVPGYDATGDPDKASQAGTCLPHVGPNTGLSGTYDPSACQWPSVRYTPGAVPVVAQGDQGDINPAGQFVLHGSITTASPNGTPITFEPGRYLVSVTADGYKIDGAHFDVDGSQAVDAASGMNAAVVKMHAYPVPLGTLRLRVFKDTAPVDGTYEAGVEQVLPGFVGHLNDVLGEVTTDFWGNRLCTNYVKNADGTVQMSGGFPVIDTNSPGGICTSNADGDVIIPNLGPDRYTATVVPPAGEKWYQTTTLEGNHDWDMWISENETGFDTEQTVGGEPVPPVDMGYVPYNASGSGADAAPPALTGTKTVKGSVVIINTYVGGNGGVNVPNAGVAGADVRGPLANPIVTLSDLDNNDQMVYVGRGNADGTFSIPNVPASNYQLTVWDYEQDYILDSFNVTVNASDTTVDVGQKGLVGWYANFRGKVCIDNNGNGKCDTGEPGVPKFPIGVKYRDNSLLDAGQNGTTTDDKGNYTIGEGYPISKFFILEAFNTRYKTTGVTVQADNQPTEKTYLGAGVDINVLPIIGLSGRVDWAVQPYSGAENGGIVGTVTYDTTRNELDPKYAATESYQPGIPGLTLHLYAPVSCDPTDPAIIDPVTGPVPSSGVAGVPDGSLCGADDGYWHAAQLDPAWDHTGTQPTVPGEVQPYSKHNADGTWTPVDLTDTYTTETWDQSKGCVARQFDGSLVDQWAIPQGENNTDMCVEAPMLGIQGVPSDQTPIDQGGFAQTVNGNYGFGSVKLNPADPSQPADTANPGADVPMPNGDYIVKVDIPKVNGQDLYTPTREEDVNVFDGDVRAPQENFPQGANTSTSGVDQSPGSGGPVSQQPGFWSSCAGEVHQVKVTDKGFQNAGGSPFEGQDRPLCDAKLVTVRGGQSVAPNFNLFTQVPLPTHFWGLTINDLGLSQDKTQAGYGEAQPLPNVPMGIYDWSGRLVDTVTTDWNGMYEALEPSTSSYNCPLPAGPCPGMYYFKGNDPGQPGHVNANYNPRFRTIGTEFQAWPGLWTVTDTAPTQVGVIAVAPGSAQANPVDCGVNAGITTSTGTDPNATPDVMSATPPYMNAGTQKPAQAIAVNRVTISGAGTTASPKTVTLTTATPIADPTAGNYAYVQLPFLTGTNASNLTTLQRAAINLTGTVGVTGTRHPITGMTATTISFRLTGFAAFTANTAAGGVGVNIPANSALPLLPAYVDASAGAGSAQITILGDGFGNQGANSAVTVTPTSGTSTLAATVTTWSNNKITATVASSNPAVTPAAGTYQLAVRNTNGKVSVNGLTFHVLGTGYSPTVVQVNKPAGAPTVTGEINANALPGAVNDGDPNTTPENILQLAVDRAASSSQALVVVWPKKPVTNNPQGEYYENLVVHSNVKIQGVGPGGTYVDGAKKTQVVAGTRLDGLGFNPDNQAGANWVAKVAATPHAGPATVPDSAVVTYLGRATDFVKPGGFTGALDGVTVTGGSQADFATAIGEPLGGATTPFGAPGALVTQGGGIFLHAAANNVTISNNVIVGNSGSYAGGIRIGTPYDTTSGSTGVTITRNRIRDNGGTNLAGGIGIFKGSTGYTVSNNDLCGNFSAEYGGALTQYGVSSNGTISKNRVYLNQSYDEGGGIIVAGELNPNLNQPSTGAGSNIAIDANVIQDNIANDDGGGLRFLSAGTGEIDVTNNMIVDNISAHEGGGIALDDSTNVHIAGNTIMKNVTTATAVTSNGQPAPAGISTASNSDQLQGTLPAGSPTYSQPQEFRDNILWGNLAGRWDPASGKVLGITPTGGTADPVNVWEAGSVETGITGIPASYTLVTSTGNAAQLALTNGRTQAYPSTGIPTFVQKPYDVGVQIITSRAFPSFREAVIVVSPVVPRVTEDYHLNAGTGAAPANNTGGNPTTPAAILHDIDLQTRPTLRQIDIGADEN